MPTRIEPERAQRLLLLGCFPALMAFGALANAIWHKHWDHLELEGGFLNV